MSGVGPAARGDDVVVYRPLTGLPGPPATRPAASGLAPAEAELDALTRDEPFARRLLREARRRDAEAVAAEAHDRPAPDRPPGHGGAAAPAQRHPTTLDRLDGWSFPRSLADLEALLARYHEPAAPRRTHPARFGPPHRPIEAAPPERLAEQCDRSLQTLAAADLPATTRGLLALGEILALRPFGTGNAHLGRLVLRGCLAESPSEVPAEAGWKTKTRSLLEKALKDRRFPLR